MKVLITDLVDTILLDGLHQLGYETDYLPNITQQEVESVIQEYYGLIITTKISLERQLIEQAGQLRFVARLGSGLDHVDQIAAKERDIKILTTPEANAGSVGEHAVGMLISMMHNFASSNEDVKKGIYQSEPHRVFELSGKTIGIIGYGNTGPEFAKRLQGFGVRVIGYDKYRTVFDAYCEKVLLEDLQQESDILSIHLPLTDETNNMINEAFLSKCKRLRYIINTSRGHILNLNALLQWLDEESNRATFIDVLDNEKTETYTDNEKFLYQRLVQQKNLFITPHIAGKSHSTRFQHAKVLLHKISRL